MKPRPYQATAIDAVLSAYAEGIRRQLVVMATGLGKTVVVTELSKAIAGRLSRPVSVLMLVHEIGLMEQGAATFRRAGFSSVGTLQGVNCEFGRDISVAMVDTLASAKGAKLKRASGRHYDLVIADEAHLALGPKKWRKVIDALNFDLFVGITATPGRADGVEIRSLFDRCVYQMTLVDGVKEGWLSYFEDADCCNIDVDLDSVQSRGGDFAPGALSKRMRESAIIEKCAEMIDTKCKGRKTLVFCVDRSHSEEMATALRARGLRYLALDGRNDGDERRSALRQLAAGELDGLTNCMIFTAGTDIRELDAVVWARPTESQMLYIQGTGRGSRLIGDEPCLSSELGDDPEGTLRYVRHLRGPGRHGYMRRVGGLWVPDPGKPPLRVLDLVGNTQKHHLVQLVAMGGRDLMEPEAREEAEKKERAEKADQEQREAVAARVREARRIDLLAPPKSGRLPWGETAYGWGLRLGHDKSGRHLGHIVCRPIDKADPDQGWNVVHIEPRDGAPPLWDLLNPNRAPLERDWAFGLAEETAARLGASKSPDGQMRSIDVTPSSPVDLHLLIGAIVDAEKAAASDMERRGMTLKRPGSERASDGEIRQLRSMGVDVDDDISHVEAVKLTRRAFAMGRGKRRA